MPTAWVTDAQLLNEKRALRDVERGILYRTPAVRAFLDEDNLVSRVLVAPKGFGKTFVLKLWRISLEQINYECAPHGIIVDRPGEPIPLISYEVLKLLRTSQTWESLWQISFVLSVLRALGENDIASRIRGRAISDARNQAWLRILEEDATRPFAYIRRLLRLDMSTLTAVLDEGADLIDAYSRLHVQAALFVDNIDEYLDGLIARDNPGVEGPILPLEIWNNGQIGAWRALRSLNGINPHCKIFVSLRKEAFHYAEQHESQFPNLSAFSVELKYHRTEIERIISNNIRWEKNSRLSSPKSVDLMERFVGPAAMFLQNTGTGKAESIMDYWLRHCTGRPRDAVFIGDRLSKLEPAARSPAAIRAAINGAAASLVTQVFEAADAHLTSFDPDLLCRVISRNTLTREELISAGDEYNNLMREKYEGFSGESHVFCTLYALGLLGVVHEDAGNSGRRIQRFKPAGWTSLGVNNIIPVADIYLIHPALSDYIALGDLTYLSRINRSNIVGDGLEWNQETDFAFVVVGDLRAYRKRVMERVGPANTFGTFWAKSFAVVTQKVARAQISGGDSFLIADMSPKRVVDACKSLAALLHASPFQMEMRVGGHAGFWRLGAAPSPDEEISEIVGVAARLEAHATAGTLLASEDFIDGISRRGNPQLLKEFRLMAETQDGERASMINIAKSSEPEESVRVYVMELLDDDE